MWDPLKEVQLNVILLGQNTNASDICTPKKNGSTGKDNFVKREEVEDNARREGTDHCLPPKSSFIPFLYFLLLVRVCMLKRVPASF